MRDKPFIQIEPACRRILGKNADTEFCRSSGSRESLGMPEELRSNPAASMRRKDDNVCHQSIAPRRIVEFGEGFGRQN
jgi:hypothetical protein